MSERPLPARRLRRDAGAVAATVVGGAGVVHLRRRPRGRPARRLRPAGARRPPAPCSGTRSSDRTGTHPGPTGPPTGTATTTPTRPPRTRSPAAASPAPGPPTRPARPPGSPMPPRSPPAGRRRSRELTTTPLREPRTTHPATRYAMAGGCYTLVGGGEPLFFKATDLGHYLLYDADRRFVSTGGTSRPSPATTRSGVADPRGRPHHVHQRGTPRCASAGRTTLPAHPRRRLRAATPSRRSTSPATRTPASRRTRRCAATSTRTPTAWPSSSSAAAPTAAGPGTSTARRTPWSTARTTHDRRQRRVSSRCCPGEPHPRPGRLADVQGLAGAGLADPRGHLLPLARALLARRAAALRQPARREQPALPALPARHSPTEELLRRHGLGPAAGAATCTSSRTTSTRSAAAPARASTGSSPTRSRPARSSTPASWRWSWASRPACPSAARSRPARPATSRPATPPTSTASSTRCTRWACARWSWSTSSTTRCPASPATTAQIGVVVNSANFLETGTFWDMRALRARRRPAPTTATRLAAPDISADQQDALFGAIGQAVRHPRHRRCRSTRRRDHCNQRGLTTLGEHVIDGLAKRHMIFDPDHMSVKARDSALDQIEELGYPGVISSHSWSTPDAYPRIYELGGFITPYAGDSTGFVEKWRTHLEWADPRYYCGIGYGADMNGLGAQGDPRGADVPNPVTYPFTGLGGVTDRQAARRRAGLRHQRRRRRAVRPLPRLDRGPRQVAEQHAGDGDGDQRRHGPRRRGLPADVGAGARASRPDSCRNPELRRAPARVPGAGPGGPDHPRGDAAVGQPYLRLG